MDSPALVIPTVPSDAAAHGVSEADLVERAKTDPRAFGDLYRLHYRAVAGCIYRRVGDSHAAEDIAADAFISAYRTIARFHPRGAPVRYWLLRIATNATNRWMKRRRRSSWLRLAGISPPTPPAPLPADGAESPLLAAVSRLPGAQQAVISLHYFEGLGQDEVAAVLGCSVGTVKSRLSRARATLRTRLDEGGTR